MAQERDAPWEAPAETAGAVLDAILGSSLGPFDEMEANYSERWTEIDRDKAVKVLARGSKRALHLRRSACEEHYASISRNRWQNTIVVHVPIAMLSDALAEAAADQTDRLADALPQLSFALCQLSPNRNDLYDRLNLASVPPCCDRRLGWYHRVSPRGYAPYFDPADLEAVPGEASTLDEDGTWRLWMSEGLRDPDDPETIERIRAVTAHLNARRKDWKS